MATGKVKKAYYWVDVKHPTYSDDSKDMLEWCYDQFGAPYLPYVRSWLYFAPKSRIYFRNEEDRTAFLLYWQDKLR